jgi:hypothetical protein
VQVSAPIAGRCLAFVGFGVMQGTDWMAWHHHYDDPGSRASRRLRLLQERIRVVLDRAPVGPIQVIVPCAGQGRDLLGVLADHPRRDDVAATLVEMDLRNVGLARAFAQHLELSGITVVQADAGRSASYVDAVPASVIVLAGFFDYVSVEDLDLLVESLPQLCAPDATAIWVRRVVADVHSPASIRARFDAAGFHPIDTGLIEDAVVHVGVERLTDTPQPFRAGERLFTFRDPQLQPESTTTRVQRHLAWRARSVIRAARARMT